jgi:hypothetical protein
MRTATRKGDSMSRLILLLTFELAAVAFVPPMSGRATNLEEPA